MKKVIINGANGYVASHFTKKLLSQNYEVIALVRDNKKASSTNRMIDTLSEIDDYNDANYSNLKVYSYSLLEENFSIPTEQLEEIYSGNPDFFHFAACLKFAAKDKDEIFETNVDGVENSIKVFLKYATPASRFFFVGTVYSCGNMAGLFEEKFYEDDDITAFRNYYEQSKRFAENIVKKHIEQNNLNGYIIRLSQVVGNNKSGVTITDYGVFDFVKRICGFCNKYPDETVRISIDPESTQNLISINNVVNCMMKVLTEHELPLIINFAGRNPIKNDNIIKHICKLLPIDIIQNKTLETANLNIKERIIAVGMTFTGGYTSTNILFDSKNIDAITGTSENEITEQSLYKMMEYFIDKLQNKKLSDMPN